MLKSLESFIKTTVKYDIKIVKGDCKDSRYDRSFTIYGRYRLFYRSDIDVDVNLLLEIKIFLQIFLKEYEKLKSSLVEFSLLRREVERFVDSNDGVEFSKDMFQIAFLNKDTSYAILENMTLKRNIGVDLAIVEIYKKKLNIVNEFSVRLKQGEIYALRVGYYSVILVNEKEKFSKFVKNIVKTRLIWYNSIYRIENSVLIDKLTGVYSREKFLLDVEGFDGYIIFINIKNFKKINQLYGSEIGDIALKELAVRLKREFGGCSAYRIFSDHFVLLVSKDYQLDLTLSRIVDALEGEKLYFTKRTEDKSFSLSIQIVYFTENVVNSIEKANIAFQSSSKKIVDFKSIEEVLREEEDKLTILEYAMENDLIVPYFQKVVKSGITNQIAYFESLMRIKNRGEILSPAGFIEVAKKSGIYTKLNYIMIKKSIESIKSLNSIISINVDIYDIIQEDFVDKIDYLLRKNRVDSSLIQVEILETEDIYKNFDDVMDFIENIKKVGCKVALDDFGSGYSNFIYLKDLQIDTLKIDMSLIKCITEDEKNYLIVETISKFAKSLNLKVTAEGVGSEDIYNRLNTLPIDFFQGYYFAKPMSLENILNVS